MFRRPPRAAACRRSVPRGARRSSPPPAGRKTFGCGLVFLAGRVKKERKQNDTDETSSSIPPNFQSKAVQRAALRLRGAEPDGDGKRWGARGGLLPPGRTEGQRHICPFPLAIRSLPVRPSKRWARLGEWGEGCCSRTAQNLPGACGGSHRPPETLGSTVLGREKKARIFHQKEKKKEVETVWYFKVFC